MEELRETLKKLYDMCPNMQTLFAMDEEIGKTVSAEKFKRIDEITRGE